MFANIPNAVALVALLSFVNGLPQRQAGTQSQNPSQDMSQPQLQSQPQSQNVSSAPTTGSTGSSSTGGTSVPSAKLCENDQKVILTGTPWLVANSMYGASSMEGTSCTLYDHVANGQVVWSSTVNIQDVGGTYVISCPKVAPID